MIQNVKTKVNYKTDKLVNVNINVWIIIPNHHEPIISKEVFDKVQNVLDKKKGYFSSGDMFVVYDKNKIKITYKKIYDIISKKGSDRYDKY